MSPSKKKSASKDAAARAKQEQEKQKQSVNNHEAAASDDEDEKHEEEEQLKSKAGESSAMKKLNDIVEEKQLDENKMKEAFLALHKQEEADKEAERLREKQLAAVKVKKEDVELIAREMEITTQVADRRLREADGDVVRCLKALVTAS